MCPCTALYRRGNSSTLLELRSCLPPAGSGESCNPSTERGRPGMLRSLLPFRMTRAQKAQSVLSAPRIEILRPRFLRIPLSPPRRTETRRRRTRLGRAAGNVILDGNGCPVPPPLSSLSSPLHPQAPPPQRSLLSCSPLTLSYSSMELFSRLRHLTHGHREHQVLRKSKNSAALLRHPRRNSTTKAGPRRTRLHAYTL